MKYRIAAAVVTIVLIVGLGVAEQIIVAKTMDEMLSRLESFIVEEDEVYDYDEICQHTQILEISITYGELTGAVGAEDFDSAQALLTRIRMTCQEFKNVYSVRIGNII